MKTKFHPHSGDAMRTPTTLAVAALLVAGVLFGWLASNLQAQDKPSEANTRDASSSTLFENVRIFDGKSAQLSTPSYVLVRGNTIQKISATPIPTDRRADTKLIDCGGRTLRTSQS